MFRHRLNLQMFAEDGEHEDELDDLDGEVIGDDEDGGSNGGGHHGSAHRVGVHQALDDAYWEKFFDLQKMHHEKHESVLKDIQAKLEELDRRHQSIPASVRAEIEQLFEAHKEAGNIDKHAGEEPPKRSSKYQRH